MGLITSLH